MRFTSVVALFATVASVFAQGGDGKIAFTSTPETAKAGQPYTITWSTLQGVDTVDLYLRDGSANNLNPGIQIASNLQNSGSYTFTPPKSVANTDTGDSSTMYTLEIRYKVNGQDQSNYSSRFDITGASGSSNASSSGSSSSSSSAASATSTVTSTTDMTTTMTMSSDSPSSTASTNATTTSTDSETASSTRAQRTSSPSATAPSGGSVASSSSLAMIFCVLAAVLYIN